MTAKKPLAEKADSHVKILSPESLSTFEESAEWYDYSVDNHFWFRWRLAALLGQFRDCGVPVEKPLRGLDVGCGTGLLISQLEKTTSWRLDGADLNLEALQRARIDRGELFYYNVSDRRPELGEAYDLILVCDVIEHLYRPQDLLEAALWHLRPGGFLAINVPALQAFFSRFDDTVGHLRRYTRRSLMDEVSGLEVAVIDLRYWGFLLLPALIGRYLRFALRRSGEGVIRKGLVPTTKLVDRALRLLMRVELSVRVPPPIGTSVLMLARKPPR